MEHRRRYRLLDLKRLCWRQATGDIQELRRNLEAALVDAIARGVVKREAIWTESLAVGRAGFVEKIQPTVLTRRETEVIEVGEDVSVLRESPSPYGLEAGSENAAKPETHEHPENCPTGLLWTDLLAHPITRRSGRESLVAFPSDAESAGPSAKRSAPCTARAL